MGNVLQGNQHEAGGGSEHDPDPFWQGEVPAHLLQQLDEAYVEGEGFQQWSDLGSATFRGQDDIDGDDPTLNAHFRRRTARVRPNQLIRDYGSRESEFLCVCLSLSLSRPFACM